jgi:hypothetical protein
MIRPSGCWFGQLQGFLKVGGHQQFTQAGRARYIGRRGRGGSGCGERQTGSRQRDEAMSWFHADMTPEAPGFLAL